MDLVLNALRPILSYNCRHPFFSIIIAVIVAAASAFFASKLTIDTDLANLLPPDHPNVVALDELRERVGGETEMQLVINSPSFEANKAFAEDIIPRSMELMYERGDRPYFSRYEYTRDTEVLKDYALYLATDSELDRLERYLNEEIEDAKLEANPFFIDFEDDEELSDESTAEGEEASDDFIEVYEELIPSEYSVNADSTSLLVRFVPTGSRSNLRFVRHMFRDYEELIAEMNPQSYHPEMVVRAGGRLERHLMEIESIMNDVYSSFSTGIGSVLLVVMLYFFFKTYYNYRKGSEAERKKGFFSHIKRMPVTLAIIGLPLLISLLINFGIAYFALGTLNTMTSVLFVILFGLGIDYGIHFYARYLEQRSSGKSVEASMSDTYYSSGRAIMTSAITTALALFVLIYADFRGFSEFGFIAGVGIVLAYLAMMYLLPAFIVAFERFGWILVNTNAEIAASAKEPDQAPVKTHRYPYARTIVAAGLIVLVFVGFQAHKLEFEYDFGNLEPEFEEYESFRELTGGAEGSSGRRNPAYVVADSYEEVDEILAAIRKIKEENGEDSLIMDVEALQERFPIDEQAEQHKLERLEEIRRLLNDPFLVEQEDDDLDRLRRAAQASEPLDFNRLPDYLTERFVTKDGEIGQFVMIYPKSGMGDGRRSIAFKDEVGRIETADGDVYYSASTSIVAANMLDLMREESFVMVAATFAMIFVIMLVAFRSFRWTIISMLPLIVGLGWLFFLMIIFGLSFNFYNLVTLPAILGIGNDNGVHLASRYREEGPRSMWNVLASTGQHISIGSFTTMLGFAGLLLTTHPGLFSIGLLAVLGIGMTLLAAVTFLPALVQVLEDNGWIRF
jgi:predicted RND superfamily exporter protein